MNPKDWRFWFACVFGLILWAGVCRSEVRSGPITIQPLDIQPPKGYAYVVVGKGEHVEVPWAFAEDTNKPFDCESEWIPGKVSATGDVGIPQINPIHFPRMRSLGLDPASEKDLMLYAVVLWQEEGLRPWESSKECWK